MTELSRNQIATILGAIEDKPRGLPNSKRAGWAALTRYAGRFNITALQLAEIAAGLLDGRMSAEDFREMLQEAQAEAAAAEPAGADQDGIGGMIVGQPEPFEAAAPVEKGRAANAQPTATPRARRYPQADDIEAAEAGRLPNEPDFSAPTHAAYRKKLAAISALGEAGDLSGLRALPIPDYDSSVKTLGRYRALLVKALEVRDAR